MTAGARCATGVTGFDEVLGGGLPRERTTLLVGGPGCGKTLAALSFLVEGVAAGEPGVFVGFEETVDDLVADARSLGLDLAALVDEGSLVLHTMRFDVDGELPVAVGEVDLGGLQAQLGALVRRVDATRVVIDPIDAVFDHLHDPAGMRRRVKALLDWLGGLGVTSVVTAAPGRGSITRNGHEAYLSDCVITLRHSLDDRIATRYLRVLKYRGSGHVTDELPFLIDDQGMSVLTLGEDSLDVDALDERTTTGIPDLDEMLGGGVYRGSSVLISGSAGTGKTSIAVNVVAAASRAGERSLYLSFEESSQQLVRNMRSIGVDLAQAIDSGLALVESVRARGLGVEAHSARILSAVRRHEPSVVVLDPISNFETAGRTSAVRTMLMVLVDQLKARGITLFMTSLADGPESADAGSPLSSLVDTWLLVRNLEHQGERNRGLYVLKSRGTRHSNQIREFVMSDDGIHLVTPYVGPGAVLTGSARIAQVNTDEALRAELEEQLARQHDRLEVARVRFASEQATHEAARRAELTELESDLRSIESQIALLGSQRSAMLGARGTSERP